ncbi:hypothetical protein TNCV_4654161 [Trichonephila clavipes]|nr:hypothetical protein TNCV_4654161 [Trichonephila clavipes]
MLYLNFLRPVYIEVIKLIVEIIRVQMIWFVREEFSFGVRSQRRLSDHLISLPASGISRRCLFASSYILIVGKRVPRSVKGCRGDPKRERAIILKLQLYNARVMIYKGANCQLCGGNRYTTCRGNACFEVF